jgi:hypothetical protein
MQRQKLEAQLHQARVKVTAPVRENQQSRCLICGKDVATLSVDGHTKECLLELVQFTASTAAREIEDRPALARRRGGRFYR